ncbi:MAG: SdrD B-like domain-containing protein, partial [Planctomycetota bacterium]
MQSPRQFVVNKPVAVERLEERRLLASISGFIFGDGNGNGVLDVGEVPQAGVTVFLDDDRDRTLDPGEVSTTTNALGEYRFDDLLPGNYYVAAIPPGTQAQTLPGPTGGLSRLGLFDIDIVFSDNGLTPEQQQLVLTAADRWESVIVGDLPDIVDDPIFGNVDDILLEVRTFSENSNNLGFYRGSDLDNSRFDPEFPTRYRGEEDNFLPYVGNFNLNLQNLGDDENEFLSTTVHEIGHALGFFDDLWVANDIVSGFTEGPFGILETGPDPRWLGENAVREYNTTFGTNVGGVPLEDEAGASHWRESVFGTELMTPFLSGGLQELSRVTVGAMQDIGYAVDYGAADFYVPGGGLGSSQNPIGVIGDDDFSNLVRPFLELAIINDVGDDIEQVNFGHRNNANPTVDRLQAISVLNSITDPIA